MFGSVANWVGVVREAERIPEYVARAFNAARSGRPGRWCSGCRRMCCSPRAEVADAAPARLPALAPSAGEMTRLKAKLERGGAAVAAARRRRLERGGGGQHRQVRRRRSTCPSSRRSAARTISTTGTHRTSATPASTSTQAGGGDPQRRSAHRHRRRARRRDDRRLHARRAAEAGAIPRARAPLGRRARPRVSAPTCPSSRTPEAFARALARLKPPRQDALEPVAARPARRLRALA